jgi:hypothetical protein
MENLKKILIFALGIVMAFGLTPAFATDPSSPTGTNNVTVGVTDSVSILVNTPTVAFGDLAADNIATAATPVTIASTSNVPIDVGVSAAPWTGPGNMPLSALQWGSAGTLGTAGTAMTSELASGKAITSLAAPMPNAAPTTQNVNLNMQVPFGSLSGAYSTIVTWTAQQHS